MMRIGMLLLLLIFSSPAARGQMESGEIRGLFERANELMRLADVTLGEDPALAESLYAQSAALYRACIQRGKIDNADLHANLGNAELRAGNTGLAIASYRRAERLDPGNPIARAGLREARSMVTVAVAPEPPSMVIDALFVWRRWAPRSVVFGLGLCAWLGLWGLLALRTGGVAHVGAGWIIACAVAAAIALGGQYAEQRVLYSGDHAVVTAPEVIGRNGPHPVAYQPSFAEAIVEGVECSVLERRDGWARVRLKDGRTTWLDADALEVI